MSEIVSPDDWQEIVDKAVEQALAGDKDARNWLAKYLLGDRGKPREAVIVQHGEFPFAL